MMDKILTVNDVAEVLQVKPLTVREMFREKRLRGFKIGKAWRTTEANLQEDLEAMQQGKSVAEATPPPAVREAPAPKRTRKPKPAPANAHEAASEEQENKQDAQQLLF